MEMTCFDRSFLGVVVEHKYDVLLMESWANRG